MPFFVMPDLIRHPESSEKDGVFLKTENFG